MPKKPVVIYSPTMNDRLAEVAKLKGNKPPPKKPAASEESKPPSGSSK